MPQGTALPQGLRQYRTALGSLQGAMELCMDACTEPCAILCGGPLGSRSWHITDGGWYQTVQGVIGAIGGAIAIADGPTEAAPRGVDTAVGSPYFDVECPKRLPRKWPNL
ncbi:MAG: hypothetical protein Fur0042_15040 [Cyanophyceae cyanobacterium]